MPSDARRPPARRIADTLDHLAAAGADVWVATAGDDGGQLRPHLVPLSLAWIDGAVVIALEPSSPTARNLSATARARLAVGTTRDVVLIDAEVDEIVTVGDASPELGARYAGQADWDPRGAPGFVFVRLRPVTVRAWRDEAEIAGRTIMRDGRWVAEPDGQ